MGSTNFIASKKSMKLFLTTLLVCLFFHATAQTQAEWAQTVNWDGVSHWSKYIRVRAAYLGPNALAVPQLSNASLDSSRSAGITAQLHFSAGDNTQSIVPDGNSALVRE